MNLSPRRREDPELNLTSLIDVVLLLVIFFMVSTTFVEEGRLRVDLPTASNEPVRAPSRSKDWTSLIASFSISTTSMSTLPRR